MKNNPINFLFIHGSWHGGWCWKKIAEKLNSPKYKIFTPTLLGMQKINDPLTKTSGLKKHVKQITDLILKKNLDNVILVGHSYAGMVITGVANNIPSKISKLIYLDAFLPDHNQSLFDISDKERVDIIKKSLKDDKGKTLEQGANEAWLVPTRDPKFFGVTNRDDIKYLKKKMVPTPVLTFEEKVAANNPLINQIEKHYIRCTKNFISEKFGEKAKNLNYHYHELESGHDVMITEPKKLIDILLKICK
jgi:pimeloyl-ACP methyl ester carboxylesterase